MNFLEKSIEGDMAEFKIDLNIFPKNVILETAYNFLDKGYFLFNYIDKDTIKVKAKTKDSETIDTEKLLMDYSDEMLNVYLRYKIDSDNRDLKNTIITTALNSSLDSSNFVEIDTSENIDDDLEKMLGDLENDEDLLLEENEIKNIIEKIKQEDNKEDKQEISLDVNGIKNAKKKFQDRQ